MTNTDVYDKLVPLFCPSYDRALDCFARHAKGASSVLELGIGTGNVAERILKSNPDAYYIGVDTDKELLQKASRKISEHNYALQNEDFSRIPFPSVDVIVSSLSIHHLETEQQKLLFGRISRTCREFLHFELIRGENDEQQRNIDDYVRSHVKKQCELHGFSFEDMLELSKKSAVSDNPLKLSEHQRTHSSNGFHTEVLFQDGSFVFYRTFRNSN